MCRRCAAYGRQADVYFELTQDRRIGAYCKRPKKHIHFALMTDNFSLLTNHFDVYFIALLKLNLKIL